jgi:hypothetical protein
MNFLFKFSLGMFLVLCSSMLSAGQVSPQSCMNACIKCASMCERQNDPVFQKCAYECRQCAMRCQQCTSPSQNCINSCEACSNACGNLTNISECRQNAENCIRNCQSCCSS